ncbi:MAG: hypothetical protein ACR2PH_05535 [Desulfobulbia bacterium]
MGVIGINLNIDVTKLDKERFFKAKNGSVYADLTLFLKTKDVDQDQYGRSGGISQSTSKEERDKGLQMPFVGNAKIFMKRGSEFEEGFTPKQQPEQASQQQTEINQTNLPEFDSDMDNLPF